MRSGESIRDASMLEIYKLRERNNFSEYYRRLSSEDDFAWEGLSWIINLLPDNPKMANEINYIGGLNMTYFSPLIPWVNRKSTLPSFSYFEKIPPNLELGGFLALDVVYPLHEVLDHPSKSLKQSWLGSKQYVDDALELLDLDSPSWLDRDEVEILKENLGEPPNHCYPIYIVTIGSGKEERIVYIGKTSSNRNRFAGGHEVALKLHRPEFNHLNKNVYFCCVVFLSSDKKYLPLEWIHPYKSAESLLDSVESQLIFQFKPELNVAKITRNLSKHPVNLQFENFANNDRFLHGYLMYNY
jgi:hypothetical protein